MDYLGQDHDAGQIVAYTVVDQNHLSPLAGIRQAIERLENQFEGIVSEAGLGLRKD
jgi:hypothetical protein